jgi:hypothetical protein
LSHKTTEEIICAAMAQMRALSLVYEGKTRVAEPYILGHDAKGALVLSAVQRSGGSGVGFRSYKADGLSAVVITERKFFGNHPDYKPKDPYFEHIICQVPAMG